MILILRRQEQTSSASSRARRVQAAHHRHHRSRHIQVRPGPHRHCTAGPRSPRISSSHQPFDLSVFFSLNAKLCTTRLTLCDRSTGRASPPRLHELLMFSAASERAHHYSSTVQHSPALLLPRTHSLRPSKPFRRRGKAKRRQC